MPTLPAEIATTIWNRTQDPEIHAELLGMLESSTLLCLIEAGTGGERVIREYLDRVRKNDTIRETSARIMAALWPEPSEVEVDQDQDAIQTAHSGSGQAQERYDVTARADAILAQVGKPPRKNRPGWPAWNARLTARLAEERISLWNSEEPVSRRAGLFGRLVQAVNKKAGVKVVDAAAVQDQVRIMTVPVEPISETQRPQIRVSAGSQSHPGL